MCLMLCLYINVRVLIHVIVLMLTIISCCLSVTPAHFIINNDMLMRMSPDQPIISCCLSVTPAHFIINNDMLMRMSPNQADRMFLV